MSKKGEHLVLVGPSGKQAGRKDQSKIAQQMYSAQLNSSGKGGGITTLLLPRSIKEKINLQKLLGSGYAVKKVSIRGHGRNKIRAAVTEPLLIMLGERFLVERGKSPSARSAIVREFSVWICEKLKDQRHNEVRPIVESAHPDLVDRISPDWWKKQIAQRKK